MNPIKVIKSQPKRKTLILHLRWGWGGESLIIAVVFVVICVRNFIPFPKIDCFFYRRRRRQALKEYRTDIKEIPSFPAEFFLFMFLLCLVQGAFFPCYFNLILLIWKRRYITIESFFHLPEYTLLGSPLEPMSREIGYEDIWKNFTTQFSTKKKASRKKKLNGKISPGTVKNVCLK